MAHLVVIRHGQASFGSANYDQLSPLGQLQADTTGAYFAALGQQFDYAVSGSLSRQQETGERVLSALAAPPTLRIDPRFNEINNDEQIEHLLPRLVAQDEALAQVVAKGLKDSKNYQKVIDAVFNLWVSEQYADAPIQSWSHYRNAVHAALQEVMERAASGSSSVIFTSGGTIATIMGLVLQVSASGFYAFYEPVFNCSITRFIFSGPRISLSAFNERSHLDLLGTQSDQRLVTYR
jgi:broad specificity phosphatase PhoE